MAYVRHCVRCTAEIPQDRMRRKSVFCSSECAHGDRVERREWQRKWKGNKRVSSYDGNVERHSTNREACKTEKELTDISSPRRLRVKETDTDSPMGCRIESGETGIQVSDGPSEDRPIAQSAAPGTPDTTADVPLISSYVAHSTPGRCVERIGAVGVPDSDSGATAPVLSDAIEQANADCRLAGLPEPSLHFCHTCGGALVWGGFGYVHATTGDLRRCSSFSPRESVAQDPDSSAQRTQREGSAGAILADSSELPTQTIPPAEKTPNSAFALGALPCAGDDLL